VSRFGFIFAAGDHARSRLRRALATLLLCGAAVFFAPLQANADVGVVLNESLNSGGDWVSNTGHSAVYFSRICQETPVKMRLCRPGEQGSVLSSYTGFHENQPFEWNVVPLSVYLYGVEDPQRRPLVASWRIKHALEERYREKYLTQYCSRPPCTTSEKAEWREMVGAALIRSVYIFAVETTVEQDRALIEQFNALPNENHFNFVTRNCADFTRRVINTYFPHSTGRDFLNDFGMSSPKAMARSFAHYAERHPEMKLQVLHIPQLPGSTKRSKEVRDGTEQLFHSKLFLVPMVVFVDYSLPAAAASYELTGRFNAENEFERYPTQRAANLAAEIHAAKAENDQARVKDLEAEERRERARVLGTSEDWKSYRRELRGIVDEAVRQDTLPDRDAVDHIFKQLDKEGTPSVDAGGELWLQFTEGGQSRKVGLSASNMLSSGSDARWAYRLLLARVHYMLNTPKRSRETLPGFRRDWALMEDARNRQARIVAGARPATRSSAANSASLAAGSPVRGND
jgi:hypothetical protein